MSKSIKIPYKYCLVPLCTNTTCTSPDKIFFSIPKDPFKRKKWITAIKRDEKKCAKLSNKSSLHCCEDHFSLEEDMLNYWQCKLTKDVTKRRLKADVVPHIFECQKKVAHLPILKAAKTKKNMALIQEAFSSTRVPSPSSSNLQDDEETSKDKCTQVFLQKPFRSKEITSGHLRAMESTITVADINKEITAHDKTENISTNCDSLKDGVSFNNHENENNVNNNAEDNDSLDKHNSETNSNSNEDSKSENNHIDENVNTSEVIQKNNENEAMDVDISEETSKEKKDNSVDKEKEGSENKSSESNENSPFQNLAVEMEVDDKSTNDALSEKFSSSENTLASAPSPKASDSTNQKEEIVEDVFKLVQDDSTIDQSDSYSKQDEESSDIPLMLEAEAKEDESASARYLEDFLFASGSNTFNPDSDSTSCDEKGLPLKKFPGIVKRLENASYEVLQQLYLILYLRNAWDTEKILVQRILEFSGFDCGPDSEDFYTRKLNLCTMPENILFTIKNILGVPSYWSLLRPSEEAKVHTIQMVLSFLQKPARKKRERSTKKTRAKRGGSSQRKRGRPAKATSLLSFANISQELDNDDSSVVSLDNDVEEPEKVGFKSVKPGPLCFKLKQCGLSEQEIIEIEAKYKEERAAGKARELKVCLPKLDPNIVNERNKLKVFIEPSNAKESELTKLKNNEPIEALPEASKKPSETNSSLNKPELDKESSQEVKDDTKEKDAQNKELEKKSENKEEEKKEENKEDTTAEPPAKKKLREFPMVLSCIEGTPDKLLEEIHNLLFLDNSDREIDDIKEHILDFDGFNFKPDSEDYEKRKAALDKMNESMVKDIARALYLDPKMDKAGTEERLLKFLEFPMESLLRPTVIAPGMLADCDIDIDGLSDSDDSIICEVVEKKVECVDLSSGEDEDVKPAVETKKMTPAQSQHAAAVAQLQSAAGTYKPPVITQTTPQPVVPPTPPTTPAPVKSGAKRTLRDFVTIKKIVETHPNEYLVDIYNLLYMQNCEPENLRKDILDFSGFEFEKGTPEYTKRKLFLDRMLYNSVRRIYNTLIHNTREVKVFSKPTMIGEIFQFLLQLPDHDTSIPPPRPAPVVKTYSSYANVSNIITNQSLGNKDQAGKLSDLKRVFQRVACFPCEYLVDVHKLLFMTDCDMKDIRANIFAFKGFNFAIGSPEFNQRKMFLEYLTFHSLRKISSVLTTKTVDMRNSTKHELASHLTEVLKEYTTLKIEDESAPAEPKPTTQEVKPAETTVEQIVITPIIPVQTIAPTKPQIDRDVTVSSSTSNDSSSKPVQTVKEKPSHTPVSSTKTPSSNVPSSTVKSESRPQLARRSTPKAKKQPPPSPEVDNSQQNFQDINLPDIEKYRQIYKSSMDTPPPVTEIDISTINAAINAPSSTTMTFQPDYLYQQTILTPGASPVPYIQQVAPMSPMMTPNMVHTFPQQNAAFVVQSPSYVNPNPNDAVSIPVECILQEEKPVNIPGPKRFKKMVASDPQDNLKFTDSDENPSSSIQLKIRDAMTKTLDEDEEDCDKPLATLVGHPNDRVLKQQICEIVENTDLQDISMNGVIQKIFNMYPKFDLNYRKEFIKSTLRSLLYQLGEEEAKKESLSKISSSDISVGRKRKRQNQNS